MRFLAALGVFVVAVVVGFGVGSYRATALDEFMARSIACEVVKQAVAKGYAGDRNKLIDAITREDGASAQVRSAVESIRRAAKC